MKVTSYALLAADCSMVTLLGSLDLSAAFDCFDHSIFLLRLERSFGIVGTVLAWTSSYLHDRMQQVRYNGQTSELCRVTCGVPQGSVLGPVYFLLYTSDVFDIVKMDFEFMAMLMSAAVSKLFPDWHGSSQHPIHGLSRSDSILNDAEQT